jgi:PAS domain S-box-containing protein
MSDSGSPSSLLDVLREIGLHDHLALIYESKEEQLAAATPAIRIGIERHEKCIYVADENTARDIIDALRDEGIDIGAAVESGRLAVLTKQDTYLRGGEFVPDKMIRFWAEAADAAMAAGFSGLRVVADMTWALGGDPGTERLIEYEAGLNDSVRHHPIVFICQYHRRRFAPEVILNVIRTHPMVISGRLVCKNPYFVPPQEFLASHHAEREVERLLTYIRDHEQADKALRASEERFRSYFALGLVGMTVTSPVKGCVEVNDEFCRIVGYDRSELLRMTWAELTHPDDLAADVAEFSRVLTGKINGYSMDKRFIRRDGKVIDVTISVKCLRRADGSVDYFVALAQDITERKRAEERLRNIGAQLAEAQRVAHIGSWEWDISAGTLNWSDEKYRIMGLDPQAIPVTYAYFLNCVHPEDRARIDEAVQQAFHDLHPFSYDCRVILPDGRVRCQHVEASVVTDERGRVARMIGTTQDITERKAAEEALRESETRFRQLAENISQVFWLVNPEGTLLYYISPAYEIVWARTCDSLYADPASWMDSIHPDDRERIADADRFRLIRGEHDHTYRIVRPDGSIRWIRDRAFPVRDESGKLIRIAGIAEDITDGKEAERQIEHFADLFQALSHHLLNIQEEERRHLARELHDEIGQTLTAAKLNLKIIASDVPPAVADRLKDSVQLLDRLHQQVRQLSLDLRPPLLDELGLVPALRWLADQQAQRSGLRVTFTANVEGLEMNPPLRTACFRVAQEAITNALRHARAATVAVEFQAEPDRVWLVVQDDGVGFDKDAMQQRAKGGASIGLLSINERVALLGGELEVNSAPGRGTEIRAWFPLALPGPNVTLKSP